MSHLVSGWETKALGDVCNLIGGGTPSKKNETYYEGHIPWATVRDMKHDVITQTQFKITEDAIKNSSTNIIKSDNVVIATRVGLGKVCLIKQDTAINQDLRGVVPLKPDELTVMYLFWWLKSISHIIEEEGTGATVQGVKLPFVKSLQIPLPPLPAQKCIVAILDGAFAGISQAITNTEKNLANARELFESYLNNIFTHKGDGWVEKKLGDLTEVKSGGTPLRSKQEYWGGDVAWYSSGELNETETHAPVRTITPEGINNSNAKLFPKGSLLMGMYDTAALKMSILDRDAAFNQAISGLKPNDEVDLKFVLHAVNANKLELLNLRRGVRQKNLSLGKIKDIVISIPGLPEQRSVVNKLSAMEKEVSLLEGIYQKKLRALTELKQSVLQKAFTGELTAEYAL